MHRHEKEEAMPSLIFLLGLFAALRLLGIVASLIFVARSGLGKIRGVLVSAGWLALLSCGKQEPSVPANQVANQESELSKFSRSLLPNEYGAAAGSGPQTLVLPSTYGKRTGDLDEMVRDRAIRALVIINPIDFFYVSGRPHGIQFESLQEFEKFANQKLRTGKLPIRVVFLPVRPDQLEIALTEGVG